MYYYHKLSKDNAVLKICLAKTDNMETNKADMKERRPNW